jgi:trehalose 6-phosphate phosphatase
MGTLKLQEPTAEFFERLGQPSARGLLLDYDGTLAPFTPKREEAKPYPGVRELLRQIMRETDTRLVMISGRTARDVRTLLGMDPAPEIWGTHGLERLGTDGSYHLGPLDAKLMGAMTDAVSAARGTELGSHLERKIGALALHWRGLPPEDAEKMRATVMEKWGGCLRSGLLVREFDGGLELRMPERNKADAVRAVLAELGHDSVVAYLGDDGTDEDAFVALRAQDMGVLVREEYRKTAASSWIRPPEGLLQFLRAWVRACGGAA